MSMGIVSMDFVTPAIGNLTWLMQDEGWRAYELLLAGMTTANVYTQLTMEYVGVNNMPEDSKNDIGNIKFAIDSTAATVGASLPEVGGVPVYTLDPVVVTATPPPGKTNWPIILGGLALGLGAAVFMTRAVKK